MENWDPLRAAITLFETSERQQQRTEELLAKVQLATERLNIVTRGLPQQLTNEMGAVLSTAAINAAGQIASNWTEANEHAERASAAYQSAARWAPARVFMLAFACFALGVGGMIAVGCWVLPKGEAIAAWRSEEAALKANVDVLRQQGGRVNLVECKDSQSVRRLCVQVDETAKTNLRGYRVVRGY